MVEDRLLLCTLEYPCVKLFCIGRGGGGYQVSLTIDKSTQLFPYSNIQISFKLSWIESFGSVLVFVLLLACMIQSAQKAKLSSAWHKDHSGSILLSQQVGKLYNYSYTSRSNNNNRCSSNNGNSSNNRSSYISCNSNS